MADNGMMYIESEDGGLFRGFHRGAPAQIWNAERKAFVPYEGGLKPEGWGAEIEEARAREIMQR